jgi:hypothetical protein
MPIPVIDMHSHADSLGTSLTREAIRSHADGLIAVNGRRTAMFCGSVVALFALAIVSALPAEAGWGVAPFRIEIALISFGIAVSGLAVFLVAFSFGEGIKQPDPHQDYEGNAEAAALRHREG